MSTPRDLQDQLTEGRTTVSLNQDNEPANPTATTRATRREIFQWIAGSDLPSPEGVSISEHGVHLDFATIDDLDAWVAALSARKESRRKCSKATGRLMSYYTYSSWLGYHGVLTCHEDRPSNERVDEICTHLNSFVAYEYERGTDLVNGRAVPFVERTGVLDCGLEHAVEWARQQPELKSFTEPAFPDNLHITLIDDTVIAWWPKESQWVVEAADDAEAGAR